MFVSTTLRAGRARHTVLRRHLWRRQSRNQLRSISSEQDGNFRVCIVGSGPAGFYTAQSLLKNNPSVTVDILERLPVPFGLVRYGVAPDHPEVKNVINQFTTLAQSGNCNFLGNIAIGADVSVKELLDSYSAVVLAYGAASDKRLNIPGEDLPGVISARNFVGWYNGLPQDSELKPNLDTKRAVVIGQGNVALDVARILLTPVELLQKTDISKNAIEALKLSRVRDVHLVGRRGPLQVSFTIKELREMIRLPETRPVLNQNDFEGIDKIIADLPRGRKRLTELLLKTSREPPIHGGESSLAEWILKFLRSPLEIVADPSGERVAGVRFGLNHLQEEDGAIKVIPTGEEEYVECGLVLRSIGYKSTQLDPMVPFDQAKGVIKNTKGKVDGIKGLYCSGWVKRGAVGVILSSLNDSMETAKTILEDLAAGSIEHKQRDRDHLINLVQSRGTKPVTFQDWLNIDEEERLRGESESKPREKIADIKEMLQVAFKQRDD